MGQSEMDLDGYIQKKLDIPACWIPGLQGWKILPVVEASVKRFNQGRTKGIVIFWDSYLQILQEELSLKARV